MHNHDDLRMFADCGKCRAKCRAIWMLADRDRAIWIFADWWSASAPEPHAPAETIQLRDCHISHRKQKITKLKNCNISPNVVNNDSTFVCFASSGATQQKAKGRQHKRKSNSRKGDNSTKETKRQHAIDSTNFTKHGRDAVRVTHRDRRANVQES